MMEVTRRTPADRKGGHLARRRSDGRLVLRERAQCAEADSASFQDIERHRWFNTNNLWIRLDVLARALAQGPLPLPVIQNRKTVDPRDPSSPEVVQLETAMGSAIECFPGSIAIAVGRDRFAPVKHTSDLLIVRSDATELRKDGQLALVASRDGQPPRVRLDAAHKHVDGLEATFGPGAPSLIGADSLTVTGAFRIPPACRFEGDVVLINDTDRVIDLPVRTYRDETVFAGDL